MSRHEKRMAAPKNYPIERKEGTYVISGDGPHAAGDGLPLLVVLRDALEYADDRNDAEDVLADDAVEVNGQPQRNPHRTVGFMDVISFPTIDEHYRVLVDARGFVLQEIDADAAGHRLARVDDKTTLAGGRTQLNLHDGTNIETDDSYDTKSSLLVSVPDLEVEEEIAFEEGNLAYIRGGQHAGAIAEVTAIEGQGAMRPARVELETEDGDSFETTEDKVFMIGADAPVVDLDGE